MGCRVPGTDRCLPWQASQSRSSAVQLHECALTVLAAQAACKGQASPPGYLLRYWLWAKHVWQLHNGCTSQVMHCPLAAPILLLCGCVQLQDAVASCWSV